MCVPQPKQYHHLPSKRAQPLGRPRHMSTGIHGQREANVAQCEEQVRSLDEIL